MGDHASMIWSIFFGVLALGFLSYGRKQRAIIPIISGIALCVIPYFIANLYVLVGLGFVFVVLPFLIKM